MERGHSVARMYFLIDAYCLVFKELENYSFKNCDVNFYRCAAMKV